MDQFLAHLEELLEVDAGTLTPETCLKDRPEWTSLTFMGLIAMVDEEYGVALSPKNVLNAPSIAELAKFVLPPEQTKMAA